MHRVLLLSVFAFALLAQNPNTAKFPGAVATDQDLLVAKDQSASTLSSAIGAADTAIPVASGAKFTAYEVVTIDAEQILVCSVASNTLNVCPGGRGFAGTTAASHVSGATVRGQITAWHHNQVAAEMKAVQNQLGGYASGPASSTDNALTRFSGTTGKLLKNSTATLSDAGTMATAKYRLIDASGDPLNELSVSASSNYLYFIGYSGAGSSAGAGIGFRTGGAGEGGLDRMYLRPNGNLDLLTRMLIGSPADDGASLLQVNGAGRFTGGIKFGDGTTQTTAASAVGQINFVYGGSASAYIDATTVNNIWRAHAIQATITEIACWTDAGTVSLTIKDSAGNAVASALTCSTAGVSTTTITSYGAIDYGEGIGFTTASVASTKNLSVSIKYTRRP